MITSKVEIIGNVKYIVERDEKGNIICQHLYDEPVIVPPPPDITVTGVGTDYLEFIITKAGTYRLSFNIKKQAVGL